MAIQIPRGGKDEIIEQIIHALDRFQADHPKSEIDVYRQNKVSVRIRIVDPGFQDQGKSERNKLAWEYLKKLPEEAQSDISTVLLLTPDEMKDSFANFEFEDPIPSKLQSKPHWLKRSTPYWCHRLRRNRIEQMLKNGFKLEVEALISKDISYVTEVYTPERLAEGDWLD